jgi:hypothetical protein
MRAVLAGLFTIVAAVSALAAGPEAVLSPDGGWDHAAMLEGHWRQVKDGAVNEEIWTNNKGNAILGVSRTVKGLEISWEYLRLENTKSGVIYLARPKGAKEETGFLLTVSEPNRMVFLNPANDWPMRIEYRRTGADTLEATVSGLDPTKGQVLQFKWARVK